MCEEITNAATHIGTAPTFLFVNAINQRSMMLTERTVRFVTEQTGNRNAQAKTRPVFEERVAGECALEDVEVMEADGKAVGRDDLLKRIKAGSCVVVSTDGEKVHPTFLKCWPPIRSLSFRKQSLRKCKQQGNSYIPISALLGLHPSDEIPQAANRVVGGVGRRRRAADRAVGAELLRGQINPP